MSRGQSPAAQGIAGLSFRSEGAASTSSRSPRKPEDVSDADVKLFKTTLIARRFPGIRDMPQNEIKQLIAVDQNAARRVNQDPRLHRTHPKTNFEANLPPPKRSTLSRSQSPEKAPFSPINPESAKKTIARPHTEAHLGLGNPYDLDLTGYLTDKHTDESKRAAPFLPSCASEAKRTLAVDYYMYSPDSQSKASERASIRQKAADHSQQLKDLFRSRRGKMLV